MGALMPVPFTPFPIFPPYEDWKPVGSTELPENLAVRRRLDEVDPACQAYLSILYCSHFLEYSSHRWAPGRAKALYTETCRYLEQMLNWSFKTGISLLDWNTPNFLQFLEFLCYPPIAWCATASHQKYIWSKGQAFRNRPINDRWNLFYRQIDSTGAAKPPSRRDVGRSAKIVKDFFTFYISENDISENGATNAVPDGSPSIPPRANPAQNIPNDLLLTLAKSRPLITLEPRELDWAFQQIADGAVPVLRPEQILFYMAIARFSAIKISHVQSLSQFQKKPDGVWVFDNGLVPTKMMELSQEFTAHLERYLQWYADGSQGYALDALHQHQEECCKRLADAACTCADAAISRAESKFRHMMFTTIRRSTSFTHKARQSEYQLQRYYGRVQRAR
ncbi:hypothetical protein ALP16_01739 [Pseudomonas savastanoi]|uniref:Integrase n=2 Tax=Pseudomonas savastanoi TaxID=29438 RepID=A0A3M5ZP76_PSESS|nr:Uncharacterized protein ALO74_00687 [Pseudomonas syringae pv. cunninghamiae]RMV08833.1 hypothetical protein ALP16_01739 [Pseudomonas savastanoi]RMV19865.1 hypothetical protein ALP15_100697 [Pseudomonas savastanoi]